MSIQYHICQSIRGALRKTPAEFKRAFKGSCRNSETGRIMTPDEVREYFLDELAKGHEVLPISNCDNFDYVNGCQGHPIAEAP